MPMGEHFARVYVPGELWLDYSDTLLFAGEYDDDDLNRVITLNRKYREWTAGVHYNMFRPAGAI